MDASEPIIGIDLGTTNSVVATVHQGQPLVIANRVGQRVTPSVVAVAQGGKRLVGQIAKRQAITNPKDTVYAAKRLIGRKFSTPQVQDARRILAYEVVAGEHDDIRVRMGGREWAVPEISAMVLRELKLDAEAYFGRPVKKAIITVPAYFNDGQRQATKDAGKIAGLEVLRLLNEPTSAALAYGFGKNVRGRIAVFDLGGGTLDVSVLEVGTDVCEVVATGGDTFLGGEDFDNRIIGWLADDFARQHQVDLRLDRTALQRLKDAAEKAKIELSTVKTATISLPFLYTPPGGAGPLHVEAALTREKLEGLTKDLYDRAVRLAGQVLTDARIKPEELKEVVLVGGMTRMPAMQEAVRRFFKREPCKGVNPDEVVALGAALHGASLTARDEKAQTLLLDVTPQSLRVAVAGGFARTLIPRNTTVPTSATQRFATSRDGQTTVHIIALQGEDEVAYRNELLGEFVLTGLREALRGEVEVDVTFDINSEGLVSVSARDRETGRRQSITLMASGGLTPEELERILREHQNDLLELKTPEELPHKREELDGIIRETKALIRLLSVSEEAAGLLQSVQPQVARGAAAMAGERIEEMTAAADELSRSLELLRGAYQRMRGRG